MIEKITAAILVVAFCFGVTMILSAFGYRKSTLTDYLIGVEANRPVVYISNSERLMISCERCINIFLNKFDVWLKLEHDLKLINSSLRQLLHSVIMGFSFALVLSTCFIVGIGQFWSSLGNWRISVTIVLVASVLGVAIPIASMRSYANEQRNKFVMSMSAVLDLMSLFLAGGMGIEESLITALNSFSNEFSNRLLKELQLVLSTGGELTEVFLLTGRQWDIAEMVEVGNLLKIAGEEGARIKDTITAKAKTVRHKLIYQEREKANKKAERLFFPGVILLAGFLAFIGYPALVQILNGL